MKLPPQVSTIVGQRPGPTVALVAGVHGNETAPIRALRQWQRTVRPSSLSGTVYVIFGNPVAIRIDQRFVDENLNRCFGRAGQRRTVEARRARELEPILRRCSAVLDLHASNSPRSVPFLIAERATDRIAKYLPVRLMIRGFDRHEPGGVDGWVNSLGRIGLCLECGYLNDSAAIGVAQRSITAFLRGTGVLTGRPHAPRHTYWRIASLYRNATDSFRPVREWADFTPVRSGQIIGTDGQRPVRASRAGRVLFVRARTTRKQECFLFLRAGS